jgi:LytTr DNA-binding domain
MRVTILRMMERIGTRARAAVYFVLWIVTACLMTWKGMATHVLLGHPVRFGQAFGHAVIVCVVWMTCLPLAAAVAWRFPLSVRRWYRLVGHVLAAFTIVLLLAASRLAVEAVLPSLRSIDGSPGHLFRLYVFTTLGRNLLLYAGFVALVHAFRYYIDFRGQQELASKLEAEIAELLTPKPAERPASGYIDHFVLRENGVVFAIKLKDVDLIEAEGNYVALHVRGSTHLLRSTMRALEQQLDPEAFVRVHRSAILPLSRVREIRRLGGGRHAAVLQGGTEVMLGRVGATQLDMLLRHTARYA